MTKYAIAVNNILIEWNPIGVPESAVADEYISYVQDILEIRKNKEKLIEYLEHMLIDVMGLDYDPNLAEHKKDVIFYANKMSMI